MDSLSTTNTPAPTPAHHANLSSFLQLLERLSIVALTLSPAIAAPFVKSTQSQAILAAETPIASALAQTLAAELGTNSNS